MAKLIDVFKVSGNRQPHLLQLKGVEVFRITYYIYPDLMDSADLSFSASRSGFFLHFPLYSFYYKLKVLFSL